MSQLYSLNRLIREDNKDIGTTILFTYDNAGNITERCKYDYTTKSGEELEELKCEHYSYDYEGDRLVNYNGKTFEYNSLGNPIGEDIKWEYGTRLVKWYGTEFTYDGLGRRTSKTKDGEIIAFTYDSDGRLIKQSNGLEFIYDYSGVVGVKYNNATYFYRRDAQGNIIAILDSNGEVVVRYYYDAWGNNAVTDKDGNEITAIDHIGYLNPFRYRGYYYDTETELYFLQTRYYDPELGRFISQDSLDYADPETINGLNLYAYCNNNPVMHVDPNGNAWWEFWKWDWAKIGAVLVTVALTVGAIALTIVSFGAATGAAICAIGFTVGVVGSLISQSLSGQGINWGKVVFDGAWGIIGIAGTTSGVTALGSVILGGITGAGQSYFSDMIFNDGKVNYKNLIYSTIGGAIGGLFAGAGAKSTILAVQGSRQILTNTIANGSKKFIGKATEIFAKNAFKLLQSFGLYLFGIMVGQSIVLGGTT